MDDTGSVGTGGTGRSVTGPTIRRSFLGGAAALARSPIRAETSVYGHEGPKKPSPSWKQWGKSSAGQMCNSFMIDEVPRIVDGYLDLPARPGLGVGLNESLFDPRHDGVPQQCTLRRTGICESA